MRRVPQLIVFWLVASLAQAQNGDTHEGLTAAQVFLQVCATTYGHTAQVEVLAQDLELGELNASQADEFLSGKSGKAWRGRIGGGDYIVTSEENGLCSLFVFSGDPADIRASVESWLPPKATGITVSEETISGPPHLETIAYELNGGRVSERWVVTTSREPSSNLKAILSWNRL